MARLGLHETQGVVFQDPARFRVLVAGRRWGKTRLGLATILQRAQAVPGRHWVIAPTHDLLRDEHWPEIKTYAPPAWLSRSPNESNLELDLVNGSVIQLKTARSSSGASAHKRLKGRGVKTAWLDEFQDMDPETWNESIRPALADTLGHGLITGTPQSFNHLYQFYRRGVSDDPQWAEWSAHQFRSIDAAAPHGHLDRAEIEALREEMDPRTFRQELEASFEAIGGRAYYAFNRTFHVKQVQLDPDLEACISADFNINPAAAVIGQRHGDTIRVWREVLTRHAGGEATRATARRCAELLSTAAYFGPIRIYGDATGKAGKTTGPADHAVLREVFPRGTWCIPKANPHVRDRVSAVNARCESATGASHLEVDPSCAHLIADLEQVVFADNGDLDKTSNPELTHASDAFGYWIAQDFPPARGDLVATIQPRKAMFSVGRLSA